MARRADRSNRPRRPLPPGFGTIWTTVAIDLVGFGIVLPILPRYAEDLKASPGVIGLVVASFSVAQMIGAPLIGRLSDRIGRKPVLILSLAGTAIGSLVTGLAGAVGIVLLGRVVDGLSGASVSVAQAAVADVADPQDRPRLLGLLGAAFGVGFVVGPGIGALAAFGGPRLPFLVAAGISGTNAVVAIRRLPETHPERSSLSAPAPAAADPPAPAGPGPAPVQVAAGEPAQPSPAAPAHDAPDGPMPADHPLAGRGAVPSRAIRFVAVAFVALFAFAGFETTFALLVQDRFGLSIGSTGAVFAVIGVALVVVQAGFIHPVHVALGEARTIRVALASLAVGLALLAVDGRWLTLVPALLLLVLGQGLVTPTMASAVAGEAEARDRGRVLGYQQSAGSLARALGPAAAGLLYGHVGVPAPYVVGAVLAAAAVVAVPGPRLGTGGDPGSNL